MANFKLIFLDIDGTLTEPGMNVPPASAQEAVKKAREHGNLIFLSTGRNLGMLKPVLGSGEYDGVIGSSGGYVSVGGKVIYDDPMDDLDRERIMTAFNGEGIFRTLECCENSFTDESLKEYLEAHSNEGQNSELLRWRRQIESSLNILPMSEYRGQRPYKMVLMAMDSERLIKAFDNSGFKDKFKLVLQGESYGIANAELLSLSFDKGTAVKKVAEYFNAPLSDTVGYGDSMNDLEMMQVCGLSICMGNGNDELKKVSDEVCGPVNENGLAESFKKHGFS
ncbi:MAG: Cof-type HAD-IIB family hydrolase [Lachnospiraceae bacterium]|jgi:Cof subfamily protein (haloacid dehalogenase superfamily)|nr:Cof-type HAD-IIB family hydrolase [Lachnospiraceae bacterium]MEE3460551.1 Cof-type HAD-IIB family hydrolase [Lachnospiraceae bacterium]